MKFRRVSDQWLPVGDVWLPSIAQFLEVIRSCRGVSLKSADLDPGKFDH
jgi:hypothetical protein